MPAGAEGSLDAELAETILAKTGMKDGLIFVPDCLVLGPSDLVLEA